MSWQIILSVIAILVAALSVFRSWLSGRKAPLDLAREQFEKREQERSDRLVQLRSEHSKRAKEIVARSESDLGKTSRDAVNSFLDRSERKK